METIIVSATIGEDRRLVVDLPPDTPTGNVEVVIRPASTGYEIPYNPEREAARAKLLAAGFLVTSIRAPEGTVPLTVEERMRLGTMPPGAPDSLELVNEDRGEY
jgi:hypothetical protein